MDTFTDTWAPRMLSVLRIMTGLLFFFHGTAKLFGYPPTEHAFPELWSLSWIAGVLDLVGGVLIVLGLFTRPAAFILAGEMAFAYFLAHASENFFPIVNGGELSILFCFIFLYLFAAGGGVWSLDRAMGRDKMHVGMPEERPQQAD